MSVEWRDATIGSVCEIYDGPHATPVRREEGLVYLGISNLSHGRIDLSAVDYISEEEFSKWTKRVTPNAGDVVFSYETRLGEAALIPTGLRCCLGRRMGLMRPNVDIVEGRFLLYYYLGPGFQETLRSRTVQGSTVERISLTEFPSFPITLPPLPEQRRIAKILGDLDDKIELNRKMNETLEQMARALFKSWFVDFDPVRAKMEGRTPTGMDAATAALFPDRLVDSELGPIPEGWEVKALGEIVECVGGGTPSTRESRYWENGNINWATPKDLASIDAPVLVDTERRITDVGLAKVSSGLLPAGTLLMSSRAPVGYLAISTIDVAINQGFISMLSSDSMSSHYMLQWCTSNLEEIRNRASGTTFAEISKASFRQMSLVLPPSDLMRCYTKAAVRYYDKITSNIHQSRTLSTLRDTLLPKLVGGEMRVGEGLGSQVRA